MARCVLILAPNSSGELFGSAATAATSLVPPYFHRNYGDRGLEDFACFVPSLLRCALRCRERL